MSTSVSTINTFDLYDFFAVLLPGIILLLGLYPLLPVGIDVLSIAGLLILLGSGFVSGRVVHSEAVKLENFLGVTTHREKFIEEMKSPELLASAAIDRFYDECVLVFGDIGLPDKRNCCEVERTDQPLETLYRCVRSYTHIDARGVSRKFQAIYGFHRSMRLVAIALGIVYFLYFWLIKFVQMSQINAVNYTPKVAEAGVPVEMILAAAVGGTIIGLRTFGPATGRYRETYVEYAITDFLALRALDDSEP